MDHLSLALLVLHYDDDFHPKKISLKASSWEKNVFYIWEPKLCISSTDWIEMQILLFLKKILENLKLISLFLLCPDFNSLHSTADLTFVCDSHWKPHSQVIPEGYLRRRYLPFIRGDGKGRYRGKKVTLTQFLPKRNRSQD